MIIDVPPLYRRRFRVTPLRIDPTPPSAGPVLVSATFDDVEPSVTLYFDQAIDITQIDAEQINVEDGFYSRMTYVATGSIAQPDATSVRLGLVQFEAASSSDILLDAGTTNNIRNLQGLPWAGVYDYVIDV